MKKQIKLYHYTISISCDDKNGGDHSRSDIQAVNLKQALLKASGLMPDRKIS